MSLIARPTLKSVVLLCLCVLVCVVAMLRTFGQTVSHKFENANAAVSSEVSFGGGGGGGGYVAPSRSSWTPPPSPAPSVSPPSATAPKIHEEVAVVQDRFSTFSIDVDTGAYTRARRHLRSGALPMAREVRVEEFVNYFRYDYPSPDTGAFGVHMEAAPSPYATDPDTYVLRIGVQGKRIPKAARKPAHLTFLIDVSGSMRAPGKLDLAKDALGVLLDQLGPEDTVGVVTYAGATRVVSAHVPVTPGNRHGLMRAIQELETSGGTHMRSGMKLAYEETLKVYEPGHTHRVVVLSDGDANIGGSSMREVFSAVSGYIDDGVTLSAIGLGMGSYRDEMMEQLANKGNGNYYYIDSMKEARRVFSEQVAGTLEVIAKDVKVQVEFNPDQVLTYRQIGYENREIADQDFRNDAVDAGEIGAGHQVTALYEVKLKASPVGGLAHVRVRAKKPEGGPAAEQKFTLEASALKGALAETSADTKFAVAVASFAEKLRESPHTARLELGLVRELAERSELGREDRGELLELLGVYEGLKRGSF